LESWGCCAGRFAVTGRFRIAAGGRIDRSRPITFTFDGRAFTGYKGDTLASALLANGVHLTGRSFKYHRPRGIMTAGSEEPNALAAVGATEARRTPNLRATQVEIYDGLVAESQNRFPSLRFDLGAINDWLSPFFPAGFYYKTFMWPAWGWRRVYEPAIRAMAGLGRPSRQADPDWYAQRYAHCDVLVVGAGPAGLAAALAAAESGASVILCDEQSELGGSLLDGNVADPSVLQTTLSALSASPSVTLLARTTAFGVFAGNFMALAQRLTDHTCAGDAAAPRERLWQIRAKQIVLATGAHERPLTFPGNDRPGVMLAGAARIYAQRYGVRAGTRAVLVTNNNAAYSAALALASQGVAVAAIVDTRPECDGTLPLAAEREGIPIWRGHRICATRGRTRINSLRVMPVGGGAAATIKCDLLLMSGGYTPSMHLFSQARGATVFDSALGAYVPDGDGGPAWPAGACRGVFGLDAAIRDGRNAGECAACQPGAIRVKPPQAGDYAAQPADGSAQDTGRAFVDFQNDVTSKDVALAVREGFVSVEHVKRYTTVGMATDQGKTSNINALEIIARQRHLTVAGAGLTTFRMPYTPVTFGTLAGAARGVLFDPVRQTPLHSVAVSLGAVFQDVGLWKRARYLPQSGENMHQAVARECAAVRSHAGIFDASTLGKIEIVGSDAAAFLERIYVNSFRNLGVGRARYGIMLREDGFLLDDGVIGRLAADRFHVTTTTGGAARVLSMMEDYLQTEWPSLRVWLTSTTEQWAVIAVQGPRAREIIADLVQDIDVSAAAMPHMSVRLGHVCGTALRLFRVSFTGELGFELNVPAGHAHAVWQAIWAAGERFHLQAYGTEAMHVLRAEKGYIIIGQDADGTATPDDMGLAWAINAGKGDFVGKRSLARAAMRDPDRAQLVGLQTADPSLVLEEGAQIVSPGAPQKSLGHVTSAYFSATLNRSIALAMLSGGRGRHGETLMVPMPDGNRIVSVVSPVFYDAAGDRLNA
jgi:sarcosine oxidase subunit alpha